MLSLLLPGGAGTEKTVSGTCSADISPSSLPGTVLHKQKSQLLHFQTLITINMTRKVQINGIDTFPNCVLYNFPLVTIPLFHNRVSLVKVPDRNSHVLYHYYLHIWYFNPQY
jgi:hypothetical protein